MASITGLTAARMLAIEASSVVSGTINSSGHLILTTHGGTTIDAGNALIAVPPSQVVNYLDANAYNNNTLPINYPDGVSLMWMSNTQTTASWPTFAGKWGSLRTTNYPSAYSDADTTQVWTRLHGSDSTPEMWIRSGNSASGWSAWKLIALDDNAVHLLATAFSESTTAPNYQLGISIMSVGTTDSWSLNGSLGTVVTHRHDDNRTSQTFYSNDGGTGTPRIWTRTYHTTGGGGGWTAWANHMVMYDLAPASFNQSSPLSAYPYGTSRIYYSPTTMTTWDFNNGYNYGEVTTYKHDDDFARQVWILHGNGPYNTDQWYRTGNSGGGWTRWRRIVSDVVAVKDQYLGANVINANGLTTFTITLPNGKAMFDTNYVINFTVTEQNNASFGSAVITNAGCRPSSTTQFLVRVNSNWGSALSGYISYTLTPVQGY